VKLDKLPSEKAYLKKFKSEKKKTSFQPGNTASVGNRALLGRPGRDAQAREARYIDNLLIEGYIVNNSHLTLLELREKVEGAKMTALEEMLVVAMIRACETGDRNQVEFFLDRTIGKVAQKIKVEKSNPYEGMSDEQLIARKRQIEESNFRTLQFVEATYRIVETAQQETASHEGTANGATKTEPHT